MDWAARLKSVEIVALSGELIRMVESQEQVATNTLVDSLEEQALLEEMLEAGKPPLPASTWNLHYLLSTPFRYPPLRHGSRFGQRHEPSLFYAALDWSAALAETAYYRFVFWSGMTAPPIDGQLTTEHTAFGARYHVRRGLRLQAAPFLDDQDSLMHPRDYRATQALGQQLREFGLDGFEYRSTRDPEQGINLALFHSGCFAAPQPVWQQHWLCETRGSQVSFYAKAHGTRVFARTNFLVDGELPMPAVA